MTLLIYVILMHEDSKKIVIEVAICIARTNNHIQIFQITLNHLSNYHMICVGKSMIIEI